MLFVLLICFYTYPSPPFVQHFYSAMFQSLAYLARGYSRCSASPERDVGAVLSSCVYLLTVLKDVSVVSSASNDTGQETPREVSAVNTLPSHSLRYVQSHSPLPPDLIDGMGSLNFEEDSCMPGSFSQVHFDGSKLPKALVGVTNQILSSLH